MSKTVNNKLFLILLIFVLTLFMFPSDSPLYTFVETDVAIFRFVGSTLPQDYVLFKDIFDHKGPIVFFINSLGYMISSSSQWGYFLLSFLFFIGSIYFTYRIAKIAKVNQYITAFYIFIMTFILSMTIGQTENFALFFNTLALYISTLCFYDKNKIPTSSQCFAIGVLLAFSFLTKVTNCALIVGICFYYLTTCLKNNEFRILFKSLLLVLLGFLLVNAIFLGYFILNNSVEEYIFASITSNLLYSGENSEGVNIITLIVRNLPFIIPFLYILIKEKNNDFKLFFTIILVFCLIGQNTGGVAYHYRNANLSYYALCFGIALKYLNLTFHKIVFIGVTLIWLIKPLALSIWKVPSYGLFYENVETVTDEVNQAYDFKENDEVLILNSHPSLYFYLDILPSIPYFTLQDNWSNKFDGSIHDQIITDISNQKYDYLICSNHKVSSNELLVQALNKYYTIDNSYQDTNYKGDIYSIEIYIPNV